MRGVGFCSVTCVASRKEKLGVEEGWIAFVKQQSGYLCVGSLRCLFFGQSFSSEILHTRQAGTCCLASLCVAVAVSCALLSRFFCVAVVYSGVFFRQGVVQVLRDLFQHVRQDEPLAIFARQGRHFSRMSA